MPSFQNNVDFFPQSIYILIHTIVPDEVNESHGIHFFKIRPHSKFAVLKYI